MCCGRFAAFGQYFRIDIFIIEAVGQFAGDQHRAVTVLGIEGRLKSRLIAKKKSYTRQLCNQALDRPINTVGRSLSTSGMRLCCQFSATAACAERLSCLSGDVAQRMIASPSIVRKQ